MAKPVSDIRWMGVGAGSLALWHRPSLRTLAELKRMGCDCVVTLVSEREGGRAIGEAARSAGLEWIWLPLPNGDTPAGVSRELAEAGIQRVAELLRQGTRVLLHCSAGIHRTGMVAYALLRYMGESRQEALDHIDAMRSHTRLGLKEHHLILGEELARDA